MYRIHNIFPHNPYCTSMNRKGTLHDRSRLNPNEYHCRLYKAHDTDCRGLLLMNIPVDYIRIYKKIYLKEKDWLDGKKTLLVSNIS